MLLVEVIIEYSSISLNRPFSYAYNGDIKIKKGVRVLVPFASRKVVGYVIDVKEVNQTILEYKNETGVTLKEIEKVLDEKPILNDELILLSKKIADYYHAPLISIYQTMLPPSLKPKLTSLSKPKIAYETYFKVIDKDISLLSKRQKEIYNTLKEAGLSKKGEITSSVIKKLIELGYIEVILKEKSRLKEEDVIKTDEFVLNDEQQIAYDSVINENKGTFLLEGVTGSGKTEVYLHLARYYIKHNKKVLLLVPEISLSYQMINNFKKRFDRIAILHSSLTDAEKYDEYRKISSGDVDIVIGARSAIFAPLDNIGIIIIDEEHSETYKQENQPYYHALTVAKMRQEYHHSVLLLGSATPSLESRARALKGNYKLLTLTKRISTTLPSTKIVNLADYNEIDEKSAIFSKTLREAIQDRLNKKEQIILLLNRRGYSPYVSCRNCGFIFKCPECNMPLSYHKDGYLLKCHHCGYQAQMRSDCPKCHSNYIKTSGIGSQKAEDELKALFPSAKIVRLDSDVAKKRLGVKKALDTFKNEEADILLGTQMIAKGHDFKRVTLAAVIQSDIGLNIPSYRASERVFSLLTQAIGRAGRSFSGEAIIQTYNPSHYAIKYAKNQDYEGFFYKEMQYRKLSYYPPYCYISMITLSSEKEDLLKKSALDLKNFLVSKFIDKEVMVIGPSEFYVGIVNKKYRRKILLKYKNKEDVDSILKEVISLYASQNVIGVSINVDPCEDF